jgi:hypothetical protein
MDTDTVVAISAVVIAVCALAVSIWQGVQNRRHNRLTVRPHVTLAHGLNYFEPITVRFSNAGVGPAWVKSFDLRVDGKSIHPGTPAGLAAAIAQIATGDLEYTVTMPTVGEAIRVGETLTFLRFNDSHRTPGLHDRIVEALHRLEPRLRYTSVYGEEFEVIQMSEADWPAAPGSPV